MNTSMFISDDWTSSLALLSEAKEQVENFLHALRVHGVRESSFELSTNIAETLFLAESEAPVGAAKLKVKWPGELRYRAQFLVDQMGKCLRSDASNAEVRELAESLSARIRETINNPMPCKSTAQLCI